MISQKAIESKACLEDFKRETWHFLNFMKMPQTIIALFCGNQSMKTSSVTFQYVMRVLGRHPVPKKNVVYVECSTRNKDNPAPHGFYNLNRDGVILPGWEQGTWTVHKFPEVCTFCGAKTVIHQRNSKKIRLASETLPGDKESTSADGTETAETKNTVYPELKKWMPPYLIKRDITFRNPAMVVEDIFAGMELNGSRNKASDIVFDFVSYSQSIQAGAGVQRMSVFCDEEPPKDFWDEQIPRLLAEDGDMILGLTPAHQMCFDDKTEVLSEEGWINYENLFTGDNILTFNMNSQDLEFKPVRGIHISNHKGKLISLKCRGFDALVTHDHKWPVKNKETGEIKFVQTDELKTHHKIFRSVKNSFEGKPFETLPDGFYSDWFVELAGWFLTDGCMMHNCQQVRIDQCYDAYPDNCEKIRTILSNLDESHYYEREYFRTLDNGVKRKCLKWTLSGGIAKQLRRLFPNRKLTSYFVFKLNKVQQQLLYDSLMDGDGCRNGSSDKFRGVEETIDSFQILCVLLGKKASKASEITKYGTTVYKSIIQKEDIRYKPFTHVCSLKRTEVDYDGIVWCPSTENETVIARRNGSIYISGNTWTFDEIHERASVFFRTESVVDYLNSVEKKRNYNQIETTDSSRSIGVMQASTYDNPTLSKSVVDEMYKNIDDPDVKATRCYGIHRHVSGRIFKFFDYKIHFIDFEEYFPDGMFHDWNHYRMIDYHPHNKWACSWMSVSPWNEAFIWQEWSPDPERIITRSIANEIALMSSDYKFKFDIIDPEAEINQPNTNTTTVQDLNQYFMELKKEGICSGAYWQTWFTKGTRGREVVRERLQNSLDCKRPFNNKVQDQGISRYVPTIWISNRCVETARSLKQWRLEGELRSKRNVDKDKTEKPAQKWSHYCTAIECAFKDKRLRPPLLEVRPTRRTPRYFQGRG